MKILLQDQVAFYRKEKPALLGGKNGWLFLVEDKLIFTKTGMSRVYRTRYNEKELEKFYSEGKVQLEIPLLDIVKAVAGTKIGAPYVMVKYRSQKGEEVASFMGYETGSYLYNLDYNFRYWVDAIYDRKKTIENRPPPPPPPPPPPTS